ncbi:MAG: bifunctional 3,4-dihydroxy-2-butanone-4-phosphate synthase/GTP cyclohydrolase II [Flavobacteriales bacterium]|nr:bifunctional 3,4-dihydroxy-2-butanone-4-phosphate synthase/GTP cyclohydrolase II [Flavobacteriales bacterium]|tara:strand:+ start:4102 stop:5304 length:1203 start_codon:yes stop_codon:yes gene_type:complete
MTQKLNTVSEAISDIKNGKIVIVVDDENRENEGDFVAAAEKVTPSMINFMATHGRGLICVPLLEKRCKELDLNLMVGKNTDPMKTQFTISVDKIGEDCTTGISAYDRSQTVKALANPNTKINELSRPGHIFPLKAINGGVLRRAGHTEAAVDLAKLANLEPCGLIVEVMNANGTMAKLKDLKKIAKTHNLKIISIEDLIAYRLRNESLIKKEVTVDLPTKFGHFKLIAYKQINTNEEHLAIVKGKWKKNEPILTRVHSSCFTGDILGSLKCDCGDQLELALKQIEKEGKGIVLYINQEGRGIGLLNKLKSYKLQQEGLDTVEANIKLGFEMDERDYGVGAQILRDLGASKLKLLTNNPTKRTGLISYGIEIVDNIPIIAQTNIYNEKYLETKKKKMKHEI